MDHKLHQEYAEQAYEISRDKGFHDNPDLSDKHHLCLILSEMMEAVEADRNGSLGRADREAWDKYFLRIPFEQSFERFIKNTVEDELADVAIRIYDLAGLRGYKLQEFGRLVCKGEKKTFTEEIYDLAWSMFGSTDTEITLNTVLRRLFVLAGKMNIDLYWYIEMKMLYNAKRSRLHGKLY